MLLGFVHILELLVNNLFFFLISIQDNIRFEKANATDDEVQAAAKMANADDFIMTLPQLSFSS
jgi:ATP-binding cassette subfamily B protein